MWLYLIKSHTTIVKFLKLGKTFPGTTPNRPVVTHFNAGCHDSDSWKADYCPGWTRVDSLTSPCPCLCL